MRRLVPLVLALALGLAACGDDDESDTADSAAPPATIEEQAPPPETTNAEPETTAEESPAEDEPDPAARAQQFYLRMDDLAIALDEAIGQALDGDPGAAKRIGRLRARIRDRNNDYILSVGEFSVSANLLQSAATQAQDALRSDDLARLADARREVAAARRKLADELTE